MKRILSFALTLSMLVNLSSQIFNAGFENNNGTPLSEWSKINADGNPVASWMPVPEFNDEAWVQFYDFYDNKIAFSTSYYSNGGAADDWLITPLISLPAGGTPTLYWKAKSYDVSYTDNYSVKISTTDQEMTSFIDLLVVEGEQAYDFNARTLDLSAYAGQEVYIAFVNNTPSGYFLALDDVYISSSENCYAPSVDTFSSSINIDDYLTGVSNAISFDVSWGALDGVDNYGIGVTTFEVPVTMDDTQTTTSKTYENVDFGTRYQMFVKNVDCGSGWTGPKSIFAPSLLPYSHGFEKTEENYGEYDSDGWNSNTWVMGVDSSLAAEGAGYIYANTSSEDTNKWMYSYPLLLKEGEGSVKVTLKANLGAGASSNATLRIGLVNSTSEEPTEYQDVEVATGDYQDIEVVFDDFTEGINYVALGNVTQNAGGYYALRVDAFKVEAEPLATTEIESESVVSIYPNPASDRINIKGVSEIEKVEIYSIEGKLVKSFSAKSKSVSFNISHLPAAVYMIKVITEKGTLSSKWIKK